MQESTQDENAFGTKFLVLRTVIEKEPEDEGCFTCSPTMPGCFSTGKTMEDARCNMRETLEQHFCVLLVRSRATRVGCEG
jgi:predicted RNase H-like HicB family nuclease